MADHLPDSGFPSTPIPAWIAFERKGLEPFRITRAASLSMGSSGIALFYAYLSQATNNPEEQQFADHADRFIGHACDVLDTTSMSNSLYRGLSGIAWTVQHFQGLLYEDDSADPDRDPNQAIVDVLLKNWQFQGKFDLWEGCTGLGVYALERFPSEPAIKLLELTVENLDQLSTHDHNGITWFTPPASMSPEKQFTFVNDFYDLGVAHGVAGVISFLSRVHALGISKPTTEKLLYGAVSWLMAQQWDRVMLISSNT